MKKIYFTITGTKFFYGSDFFEKDMKVTLKKEPDNYTAIKNCVLLARDAKNLKLEKKYLPALIRVTQDDAERAAAQARLEAL